MMYKNNFFRILFFNKNILFIFTKLIISSSLVFCFSFSISTWSQTVEISLDEYNRINNNIPPCFNDKHPDYPKKYCQQEREAREDQDQIEKLRFQHEEDDREREEDDREYQREQDKLDRVRQAEEDHIREQQEARREAEEAVEDARREEERKNRQWEDKEKELKEKCEDLDEDLYQAQLDKRDKLRDYENDFYGLEEEIKGKEAELTEKEIELDEALDGLRKSSNEQIQNLKDQMKGELAGLDQQIRRIEGAIDSIADGFIKLQEQEMDLFNLRRKSQNEAYIKCYDMTQTQMLKKLEEYKMRAATGTLRRRRISDLVDGDSGSTSQQFNAMFERELNRCVNSEVAQRMKENQKNDVQLMEDKIELQRKTLEGKKEKLLAEIKELNTNKKLAVLDEFKEKMENVLNEFEISYDRASDQAKNRREHALKEIEGIKQKQARLLGRREEEMNMDARLRQKVDQCNQEQALNLFKTNQERHKAWMEQRQKQQQQILQQQQQQVEGLLKSRKTGVQ